MRISNERKTKKLPNQTMQAILKWHSCILVACAILAYYFSVHSYNGLGAYAARHANYGLQNIGVFFIFLEITFAYSMNALQGGAYWLPWLRFRKARLDERQVVVRQRVYEQAFVIVVFTLFTLVPVVFKMLARYSDPAQSDLFGKSAVIIGVALISLPASLAAWQKDS